MEIKDLLAKIAEYDEMEAPDGMNIVESKEGVNEILTPDEELERGELKAKKRIYLKAIDGLQGLQEFLMDGASPSQGLDPETQEFVNQIQEMIAEIDSRSLAFD